MVAYQRWHLLVTARYCQLFSYLFEPHRSHDEYDGGVAVQKVNLKTRDQERIYCVMNFTIMIAVSIWRVEV